MPSRILFYVDTKRDMLYHADLKARLPEFAKGDSAWSAFPSNRFDQLPPLTKPPVHDEPHCDRSKTIKIRE